MYSRASYHDEHYAELVTGGRYGRSAAVLRAHVGPGARLLDFGCGNGSFLVAARDAGFNVEGIEFSPSAIEGARERTGLPVSDLETVRARGGRFDVVHLGDVLEHLPHPRETLTDLAGLLTPGGAFFIEGPLQSNPSVVFFVAALTKKVKRLLGRDRPGVTPPTHLILVAQRAQRQFFTRAMGYREVFFHVSENGWPYRVERPTRLSPGGLVRRAIGLAAVIASRVVPGRPRPLGNRFEALLEVP